MLTKIKIKNYKSILEAEVKLSPFTLLIGANGTGKSNFLHLLHSASAGQMVAHFNHGDLPSEISIQRDGEPWALITLDVEQNIQKIPELAKVITYKLNPHFAGASENLAPNPEVNPGGAGIVRVLDSLKTGDREELFHAIETKLKEYIPEIEKLSFVPGGGDKRLQVREKHIKNPVLVHELSEGTRLVLMILTILYQERPPSLMCIEDLDHSLHPRLLQRVMELCFDLAGREGHPQIIATTHNPYLVDLFKDREDGVIIVEKEGGYTKFTTLEERLEQLGPEENPLGELWFSGALGGVPAGGE